MQKATKQELRKVKSLVRMILAECPSTRGDDNKLYYTVCKVCALQQGIDIRTIHFATVFLGNPLNFPRFESVVRMRRMIQRQQPELQAKERVKAGRALKEADYVKYARKERKRRK